jgi:hypothetical protein
MAKGWTASVNQSGRIFLSLQTKFSNPDPESNIYVIAQSLFDLIDLS